MGSGTTSDTVPNANGEACTVDPDCASNACHAVQGQAQGLCSECKDDASCQTSGVGKACVPKFADTGLDILFWECGAGALGDTCEADTSCEEGLKCATFTIVGMDLKSCSECQSNADCMAGTEVCNLGGDIGARKTYFECKANNSLDQDAACTPQAEGAEDACKGFCADAEIPIFGKQPGLGLCGACRPDHAEEDCGAGKTCSTPTINPQTGAVAGAKCM